MSCSQVGWLQFNNLHLLTFLQNMVMMSFLKFYCLYRRRRQRSGEGMLCFDTQAPALWTNLASRAASKEWLLEALWIHWRKNLWRVRQASSHKAIIHFPWTGRKHRQENRLEHDWIQTAEAFLYECMWSYQKEGNSFNTCIHNYSIITMFYGFQARDGKNTNINNYCSAKRTNAFNNLQKKQAESLTMN